VNFCGCGSRRVGFAAAWWPGIRIGLQVGVFRGMVGVGCP
jgi:hypothetical protein